MAEPQPLRLISETKFDHRVPDGLPKSNPTVDLAVTWDAAARNLLIYRPRDQVVSKIHQYARPGTTAPEPLALKWKPDGQFLAVGWSDGYVRLMGLENNKAAHHIRVTEDQSAGITHIGWACNSVSKTDSVPKEAETASWRHALDQELQTAGNPPELDLPRELTFLDVESSLPKLSPLPSASAGEGEDAMVFTLRTGIEFLFRPFNTAESDEVFVMVVGTSDGRLHLSIYDSFVIGDFRYTLPSSMYKPGVLQLIHHAAHPSASTHCLILKHPADEDRAVYLVPMDLPFVPYSPINLALLASKLTTLQKLLRYVKQSQLHATVEYNNTRELPSKFLRSIQEDLQGAERGPTDIVQALFHTVVTGHTHEVVKEWLVDQLAERGHKRWDKAAVSGLEALRALVHENLLPALERCAVILSRLRGLAQFHDARDDIGFSAAQVARAMDVVACLRLAAHRVLLHVMEELDLFTAFSGWLRFQIDRLASSSSATEELNEKEAGLENGKVLAYIQRYLLRSPMALFFDPVANDEREADWKFVQNEPALLDAVDAQIARQEDGQPYMKALPQLAFLVAYLEDRANGIFNDIAEAQKRSVRFGQPTRIVMGSKMSRIDCVMGPIVHGDDLEDHASTFVAAIQEGKEDELYIFRTTVRIINGISTTTSKTCAALRLSDHKITDMKFLDHETLVLLLKTTGTFKPTNHRKEEEKSADAPSQTRNPSSCSSPSRRPGPSTPPTPKTPSPRPSLSPPHTDPRPSPSPRAAAAAPGSPSAWRSSPEATSATTCPRASVSSAVTGRRGASSPWRRTPPCRNGRSRRTGSSSSSKCTRPGGTTHRRLSGCRRGGRCRSRPDASPLRARGEASGVVGDRGDDACWDEGELLGWRERNCERHAYKGASCSAS